MKKIYTLFVLMAAFFAASAQSVDFEIVGFADGAGNPISVIEMNTSQDLMPRVILRNNGPDVVAVTDSIIFDITYNEGYYATSLILTGTDLHSVIAGEQVVVDHTQPIWTAATMNQYHLVSCTLCYEVRIVGRSTDPEPTNNTACIPVNRVLSIDEGADGSVSVFPNPASTSVTVTGVANSHVQLFDLSGRELRRFQVSEDVFNMDIEDLTAGIYLLHIQPADGTARQMVKVVKR